MSLGNVNIQLGLNTSPATQSLQAFYQKLNQGAQKAANAQKKPATELQKLVDKAKKLGLTYDKATNTFKNGLGKAKSIDEVRKKVEKLDQAMDQMKMAADTAVKSIADGFKGVSGSLLQGVGQQIGQQMITPLLTLHTTVGQAAQTSVKSFAEIDSALRQTLAIAGESPERFGELSSFLNQVGAESVFTAQQLGEASIGLARAGFSADELKEALPGIAQGAAAASESMSGMSDVVIAALGGFQISTAETASVVDVLTAAANNSNTSVVELGEGLKYVGPIAKNLGLTFEDTAAVAAMLANNGIKASQMGTALRQGLSRLGTAAAGSETAMGDLSRGTANQAEVLKRLGVELQTANGQLVPFPELLEKLRTGFGKLNSLEQGQAAKILFGQESATAFISLLNTSADETNKFFQVTSNAAGTAAQTAQDNLKGIAGSLQLLEGVMSSTQAIFGQFLSAGLKPVIDGIRAVLSTFNALPGPVQTAALAITTFGAAAAVAALAVAGLGVASNLGLFTTIANGAATAGAALTGFATVLTTKAVVAINLTMAKIVALNVAMAKVNVGALVTAFGKQVVGAMASAGLAVVNFTATLTTASIANAAKAIAFSIVQAMANVITSMTAGAAAVGKFIVAAAPLGTAALAAGSVAAAFQTYTAVMQESGEVTQETTDLSKELSEAMNNVVPSIQNANTEWERSVERVGAFQASLDLLRRTLRLVTAETAEINNTTVTLGEQYDAVNDQLTESTNIYKQQLEAIKNSTAGTQEHQRAIETAVNSEKAIKENIDKHIKSLKARRKEMMDGRVSVDQLTEAEQTQVNTIDALISGLDAQATILDRVKEQSGVAAGEMEGLSEATDEFGNAASGAAGDADKLAGGIDGVAESAKKAKKNLSDQKDIFKAMVKEMDKSFKKSQELAREEFETDVAKPIEDKIEALDRAHEAAKRANQDEKRALESQEEAVEKRIKAEIDGIKDADEAASKAYKDRVDDLKDQEEAEEEVAEARIQGLRDGQRAADEQHSRRMSQLRSQANAARSSAEGRVSQLQGQIESMDAAYDAETSRIEGVRAAEDARYDAADERAAASDQARISSAEDNLERVRAAGQAEIDAAQNAKDAFERGYRDRERAIERAHDINMRGYDEEIRKLDQIADKVSEAYDQRIGRLRELTPAERELEALRKAELMKQAGMGGEEGLRARAQLERMAREEEIARIEKEREAELAQLEAQKQELEDRRRQEEIAYDAAKYQRESEFMTAQLQYEANIEAARNAARTAEAAAVTALESARVTAERNEIAREIRRNNRAAAREREDIEREKRHIDRKDATEDEIEKIEQELVDYLNDEIAPQLDQLEADHIARKKDTDDQIRKIEDDLVDYKKNDIGKKLDDLETDEVSRKEKTKGALERLEDELVGYKENVINPELERLEGDRIQMARDTRDAKIKLEEDLQDAKDGFLQDDKDREFEFLEYKEQMLRDYESALGNSHTNIIVAGQQTWQQYADNAIAQIRRVARAASAAANGSSTSSTSTSSTTSGGTERVVVGLDGSRSIQSNFAGGPIDGGALSYVNELGQEAFLGKSGKLSWIDKKANGVWRAPESGTIIPAHISAGLGLPDKGVDLSKAPAGSNASSNASKAQGGHTEKLLRALSAITGGDNIQNNVTIQSENTVKAASDMMVELTKVKRRRYY